MSPYSEKKPPFDLVFVTSMNRRCCRPVYHCLPCRRWFTVCKTDDDSSGILTSHRLAGYCFKSARLWKEFRVCFVVVRNFNWARNIRITPSHLQQRTTKTISTKRCHRHVEEEETWDGRDLRRTAESHRQDLSVLRRPSVRPPGSDEWTKGSQLNSHYLTGGWTV